jgi:ABC-type transport system involved in multi-copper enzyme maturation permease subunit
VIRFAWLQSRTQTLVAVALLAALAVAAAITGVQLSHLYNTLVLHCHTGCGIATQQFLSDDSFMNHALDLLARAVPALFGIVWGAPLLTREFESGTFRLAWTQSVSRSRWLVTKLVLGAIATAALAGALTLTITWWYRALDPVSTTPYAVFDRRDIAPIAYALFAFASGALIGAVVRRTVPAMAATLGVFAFARVATSLWIRPNLLPPVRKTFYLRGAGPSAPLQIGIGSRNGGAVTLFVQGEGPKDSWTLSQRLLTKSGNSVSSSRVSAFLHQHCPKALAPPPAPLAGRGVVHAVGPNPIRPCFALLAKNFKLVVTYQPANRYWAFQWLESGIFVVLALAAAGGCYWWVTRRAS